MTKRDKNLQQIRQFMRNFKMVPKNVQDVEIAEIANAMIPIIVDHMSDNEIQAWADYIKQIGCV